MADGAHSAGEGPHTTPPQRHPASPHAGPGALRVTATVARLRRCVYNKMPVSGKACASRLLPALPNLMQPSLLSPRPGPWATAAAAPPRRRGQHPSAAYIASGRTKERTRRQGGCQHAAECVPVGATETHLLGQVVVEARPGGDGCHPHTALRQAGEAGPAHDVVPGRVVNFPAGAAGAGAGAAWRRAAVDGRLGRRITSSWHCVG